MVTGVGPAGRGERRRPVAQAGGLHRPRLSRARPPWRRHAGRPRRTTSAGTTCGSLLRLLHVRGATSRADADRRDRPEPQHGRERSPPSSSRPGWSASRPRSAAAAAGRPSIVVEPASDDVFVAGRRHRRRAPDGGPRRARRASCWTGASSGRRRATTTSPRTSRRADAARRGSCSAPRRRRASCVGIGVGVCGRRQRRRRRGALRAQPRLGRRPAAARCSPSGSATGCRSSVGNDGDLGAHGRAPARRRRAGVATSSTSPARSASAAASSSAGDRSRAPAATAARSATSSSTRAGRRAAAVGAAAGRPRSASDGRAARDRPPGGHARWRQVLAAYAAGDAAAGRGAAASARWLGVGVANLVNIFNPQLVALRRRSAHIFAAPSRSCARRSPARCRGPRDQVRLGRRARRRLASWSAPPSWPSPPLLEDPLDVLGVPARRGVPRLGQGLAVQQVGPAPRRAAAGHPLRCR